MSHEIAFVGVSGHGRECLDIAEAMVRTGEDLTVRGFYDDAPSQADLTQLKTRGYPVLGSVADLLAGPSCLVCLGIGDGPVRRRLADLLVRGGFSSPVLVHPDSTIGTEVRLGAGTVVFAGARLTTNIAVGCHVHVNQNATIGHDSVLEDYATINPQAAISGAVTVGSGAVVGAGAVVLQGLSIGRDAVVGGGACVVRGVPPAVTVKGVPGR